MALLSRILSVGDAAAARIQAPASRRAVRLLESEVFARMAVHDLPDSGCIPMLSERRPGDARRAAVESTITHIAEVARQWEPEVVGHQIIGGHFLSALQLLACASKHRQNYPAVLKRQALLAPRALDVAWPWAPPRLIRFASS